MSLNREGTMYGNGRGMRGSVPQSRMMQDGRGMRTGAPQGRKTQDGRGMADDYRREIECECVVKESAEDCICQDIPESRAMQNRPRGDGSACVLDSRGESGHIPAGNRMQLLTYIDEVSFCAYDLMLYLDTHPEDECAIEYFGKYNEKRDRAVEIYEENYGPLQYHVMNLRSKSMTKAALSSVDDSAQRGSRYGQTYDSVKWVTQPWPWEGGDC